MKHKITQATFARPYLNAAQCAVCVTKAVDGDVPDLLAQVGFGLSAHLCQEREL